MVTKAQTLSADKINWLISSQRLFYIWDMLDFKLVITGFKQLVLSYFIRAILFWTDSSRSVQRFPSFSLEGKKTSAKQGNKLQVWTPKNTTGTPLEGCSSYLALQVHFANSLIQSPTVEPVYFNHSLPVANNSLKSGWLLLGCLHDNGSSSIRNEKQNLVPCLHENASSQTRTWTEPN